MILDRSFIDAGLEIRSMDLLLVFQPKSCFGCPPNSMPQPHLREAESEFLMREAPGVQFLELFVAPLPIWIVFELLKT